VFAVGTIVFLPTGVMEVRVTTSRPYYYEL
jgi:hypothetical protein